MRNKKQIYEVDRAMLGHLFCGDGDDLEDFCDILRSEVADDNIEIIPMELWNGARHDPNVGVPATAWNKAIDKHAKTYPDAWSI